MLLIRCAACKKKLWKYKKIGPGEVLRCHKDRIVKEFGAHTTQGHKVHCQCGKEIGIDKGGHIKMVAKAFIHTGTKVNK